MNKHTPGPWHTTESIYDGGRVYVSSEGNDRGGVCLCQREEDARLIAAAPELLTALIEAVGRQAYRPGSGPDWWDRANTAIAKATGGAA